MSVAVDELLVVDEGVDHLPGLGVGVSFVSTAVHCVVEGAVLVSENEPVFGFALVGYIVECIPEAIGVVI
jgi:hypothetical protein